MWVIVLFTAVSCQNTLFTPLSSGRPYEVMVVCSNQFWVSPAGRALFKVLDTDVPALPQPERSFHISHVVPEQFDQVSRIFRNIIIVDVDKASYTKTSLHYQRDVYSSPQMIMTIQSPDEENFRKSMQKYSKSIVQFFTRAEFNRQVALLKKEHSSKVDSIVHEKFGCHLWIPREIASTKRGKDFLWASTNTPVASSNVCVYSYPYHGSSDFTPENFLRVRDSVMKVNIPGEEPKMYMSTNANTLECQPITVRGQYCYEVRGLWEMENDCMGGPFVSHSRVDTVNNRVIVVEGFVYAPSKKKRTMIRVLEGSLYSLELPKEKINKDLDMGISEVTVKAKKK